MHSRGFLDLSKFTNGFEAVGKASDDYLNLVSEISKIALKYKKSVSVSCDRIVVMA